MSCPGDPSQKNNRNGMVHQILFPHQQMIAIICYLSNLPVAESEIE